MGVDAPVSTLRDPYSSDRPYTRMGGDSQNRRQKICLAICLLKVIIAVIAGIAIGISRSHHDDSNNQWDSNPDYNGNPTTQKPVVYGPVPGTNNPSANSKPSNLSDYVWKMHSMMTKVHPCKDFYKFACGSWINDHPAEDYQSHNRFQSLRERVSLAIRDSLVRFSRTPVPAAVKKARALYRSCMDTRNLARVESESLKSVLKAVGAIGPVKPNLVDMTMKMAMYRSFPFGIVEVIHDPMDASKTAIVMDQPDLHLRSLAVGKKEYKGYHNFIRVVKDELDRDISLGSQLFGDIYNLIDFQYKLTQLTTDKNDQPPIEARYHKYRLGELNAKFPGFDWRRLIEGFFSDPKVNISLSDDEPVIVYAPDYFQKVGALLEKTDRSVKYNYAQWKLVEEFLPYMSHKYSTARAELLKALGLYLKIADRWKTCTKIVDITMSNVTGRLYVENEFEPAAVNLTKEMVTDIRKVFKDRMQTDSWMDPGTKQKAMKKLDAIGELIGYPPEIMNDTLLDMQFKDLTIGSNFFENIVAILKRKHLRNLKTLHRPTLRTQWNVGPTTVNAFYQADKNIIVIPAGILRKPFFSVEYPKVMLYGSLGLVVAHEMTHGFDNKGRKYDENGSLVQWWSSAAVQNYRAKEKCYVDQYSAYDIPNSRSRSRSRYYPYTSYLHNAIKLNGTKTLGENIADNGGVRDAYNAYTEWTKRQKTGVPELPFLGLTNNQVFYLTFAQRFCENTGSKSAILGALRDLHSPGALRIKGTLQNSNHFAATYKCAAGTAMNPHRKKCRIW